jgi:GNAT superfamily N-acetyltransferase
MTPGGFSLETVDALSPAAMTGLRQIYEDGFPPHERADFATLTAQRRADEQALALVSERGEPRGFALLRPLGATGWMYLRYLVVDGAQRGQGLGGQLWEQLTTQLRDAGYTLLVWDVEDPDEPGLEPGDTELRWRRIRFYQRQGGYLLPVTGYRTPAVSPGGTDWLAMRLMAAPLAAPLTAPPLASDPAAVVEAVYRFRWELEPGQFPAVTYGAR